MGTTAEIYCPTCKHQNKHTILASYRTAWGDDAIWGGTTHDFLCCNGCETGTYRMQSWCSEDQDHTTTLYPPRGDHTREPHDFYNIPSESQLTQVYKQTITAFNSALMTLAGAGVRLLIEGICKEQRVTSGPIFDKTGLPVISKKNGLPVINDNLDGKINGLAERDIISKKQRQYLHEIRFLGNDSAHELYIPDASIVARAIDIVEHILEQVYEQPEKASELAARPRPKT